MNALRSPPVAFAVEGRGKSRFADLWKRAKKGYAPAAYTKRVPEEALPLGSSRVTPGMGSLPVPIPGVRSSTQ